MTDWRKMKGYPKDREVLVYDPDLDYLGNKGVIVATFGKYGQYEETWYAGGGCRPTPTRWAYLPKPPNGAPQT